MARTLGHGGGGETVSVGSGPVLGNPNPDDPIDHHCGTGLVPRENGSLWITL